VDGFFLNEYFYLKGSNGSLHHAAN
jgi:hypothetical protein